MNAAEFAEKLDSLADAETPEDWQEIVIELTEQYEKLVRLVGADVLWPLEARNAAEAVFGGGIHNPRGRTHKSLDRRIQHALRVWRSRYGLNPAQLVYAGEVLAWSIKDGAKGTNGDKDKLYPFVLKRLEQAVNDERFHAGFVRRSEYNVDVRELLGELYEGINA